MARTIFLILGALFTLFAGFIAFKSVTLHSLQRHHLVSALDPETNVHTDGTVMIERLQKAVRLPTISHQDCTQVDHQQLVLLHDLFKTSFPLVHSTLNLEVIGNHSLLYTWEGTEKDLKPFMLAAHLDVVPIEPGTEKLWSSGPFDAEIRDGYVWGRGTMDDKQSVLAILEAVEDQLRKGVKPRHTIYLAFGHDEEVSGFGGASRIASVLLQRNVELEFVLDEGMVIVSNALPGITKPMALIAVAEKGGLTVELSTESQGGHSSMPPVSGSSTSLLTHALAKLEDNPFPAELSQCVAEMFEFLTPEMPMTSVNRLLLANLWLFKPLLLREFSKKPSLSAMIRTTTAVTIIQAGTKENVLPKFASATVNFRINPGSSIAQVVDDIKTLINEPKINVTVKGVPLEPSPITSAHTLSFSTVQKAIHTVFPEAVVAPALMLGNTDTRHYWSLTENILRFNPLTIDEKDVSRLHGVDERIEIKNYVRMVNFYNHLIRFADSDINTKVEPS